MSDTMRSRLSIGKLARTLLGLFLAPVIGAAIVFTLLAMFSGRISDVPGAFLFGANFGLLIGVPGAMVLGLPLHLLMLRLRWTSLPAYLGFGALLGVAAFLSAGLLFNDSMTSLLAGGG